MDAKKKVDTLALKRIKVLDERSNEIRFSDLYKDKKTIFIFLRHFGCIACRAHVTQVLEQFRAGKIKTPVIFIGNGHPSIISAFKTDLDVEDAVIYTDPKMTSFDACHFNRGLTYLLQIASAKEAYRLSKKGFSQGKQTLKNGSHTQMGGVIVFSGVGEVLYYYSSEYLGDLPGEDEYRDR